LFDRIVNNPLKLSALIQGFAIKITNVYWTLLGITKIITSQNIVNYRYITKNIEGDHRRSPEGTSGDFLGETGS